MMHSRKASEKKMEKMSLNHLELQDYQPNRYPFLMIDYVEEVVPGKSARGYKNLSNNEWYFPVHFPGGPNMPGALQLEALAQMLTVAITTLPDLKGKVTHALQHTVRFKREILPGERLDIHTEVLSWRRGICKGKGVASVNGEAACEAEMMITIPEILEEFLPRKKAED
jgi:3-hydroxyacyl-[acyl-carrier-protein] dehydratase